MWRSTLICLVCLLGIAASEASAQDQQSGQSLDDSYSVQLGDYAAVLLPEFLKISDDLDDPVVVTYEPDPNTLDVEVFGGYASVEDARKTVGMYWSFIDSFFLPYMERRFNIQLSQGDFRIVYYDRTQDNWTTPVVQMVEGQFIIP